MFGEDPFPGVQMATSHRVLTRQRGRERRRTLSGPSGKDPTVGTPTSRSPLSLVPWNVITLKSSPCNLHFSLNIAILRIPYVDIKRRTSFPGMCGAGSRWLVGASVVHLRLIPRLGESPRWVEIGHGGNISVTEIKKGYKPELPRPTRYLTVKHSPAHRLPSLCSISSR